MKKKAYDADYLPAAQESLAAMLDVAVHCFRLKPTTFYSRFLKSDYPRKIESGDPFTIWGKSGTEIALDIAKKDYEKYRKKLERNGSLPQRSKEYWAGWALARYQWSSGKTFAEINSCMGIEAIIGLYEPYHEMDIRQFCLKMDSLLKRAKKNERDCQGGRHDKAYQH